MGRQTKNQLIYWGIRWVLLLVAYLPLSTDTLGRFIGALALLIGKHERRRANAQLKSVYEDRLGQRRMKCLVQGVASQLGRSAVEMIRLFFRNRWVDVHLSKSNQASLDHALSLDRGVIFVTGHVGNWELMAADLARRGYPIHTVVKESYDPKFTVLIQRVRSQLGVQTIFRGAPGASAAMLRVLRSGGVLGFLIDQDTNVRSLFVPFFGRLAKTPIGPAVFAHRFGAPLVVGTIHRRTNNTHAIDISPCDIGHDIQTTIALLSARLEAQIRKHPSEWVWFHRRWKTRPEAVE